MDRFSNKFAIIGPKIFLSESPIWVKSKNSFIWLDVYKKKIYIYDIFKKKLHM